MHFARCYALSGARRTFAVRLIARNVFSIVLEAPIPKMSLGDKTSLHVINTYSDKQQLSHNIGWPVTHMHTYMRACRPAYSHVEIHTCMRARASFKKVCHGECVM